jgi:heme-degrading monooxygenase HmoA
MEALTPYIAVIFTSTRTEHHDSEYAFWSDQMTTLVREQPGDLGHTSVRDPVTREGITVSYFADDEAAVAWKQVAQHEVAQQMGREVFYSEYRVEVTTVFRTYRAMI